MPTTFTIPAIERSTYVVEASFTDDEGVPVAPNNLTWSLLKKDGSVVNGRENVPIASASAITIVLHGDDLALTAGERSKARTVLIQGIYDSTLGTNLEIKDTAKFTIVDLLGVE